MGERKPRKLLLASVLAFVATLALILGAGYAGLAGRVVRMGRSIVVGPSFSGDTLLDGGRTLVVVEEFGPGDRSIHVSRSHVPGRYGVRMIERQRLIVPSSSFPVQSVPAWIAGFVVIDLEPGPMTRPDQEE